MRLYLWLAAALVVSEASAADVIGGGLRVFSVRSIDETKAEITVQGNPGAETYVVDCIGATWGFANGTQNAVKENQRSQAIAERACRHLEFKSSVVTQAGEWRAPVQQESKPSKPAARTEKPKVPDIASIYSNYTPEQYPRTFALWGSDGVEYLRVMERLAVVQVEASWACNKATYVGLSESRSKPPKNAVMFVDCENGNRFYVGAPELRKRPNDLAYKKVY